jgi:hypothetical protein
VCKPALEPDNSLLVLSDPQDSWTASAIGTPVQVSRGKSEASISRYLGPSIECLDHQSQLHIEDPYLVNPKATLCFLELFFRRSAGGLSMLFPETSFTRWVQTSPQKHQDECFVLYVILGLGSLSATTGFGCFAEHCTESLRKKTARLDGNFGVAAMHARLLLAHYHYALGNENMGWELSRCTLTAMNVTRLSCEQGSQGVVTIPAQQLYGLSQAQLVECQRRLFWAAFLLDVGGQTLGAKSKLTISSDGKACVIRNYVIYSSRTFNYGFHATQWHTRNGFPLGLRYSMARFPIWACSFWTCCRSSIAQTCLGFCSLRFVPRSWRWFLSDHAGKIRSRDLTTQA